MTPALRAAVKAWQALLAKSHRSAALILRCQVKRFAVLSREAARTGLPLLARLHREDAAALRAAVKLLKAAGRSK